MLSWLTSDKSLPLSACCECFFFFLHQIQYCNLDQIDGVVSIDQLADWSTGRISPIRNHPTPGPATLSHRPAMRHFCSSHRLTEWTLQPAHCDENGDGLWAISYRKWVMGDGGCKENERRAMPSIEGHLSTRESAADRINHGKLTAWQVDSRPLKASWKKNWSRQKAAKRIRHLKN